MIVFLPFYGCPTLLISHKKGCIKCVHTSRYSPMCDGIIYNPFSILCSVEEIFLLYVLRHQREESFLQAVGKVECTVKNLVRERL